MESLIVSNCPVVHRYALQRKPVIPKQGWNVLACLPVCCLKTYHVVRALAQRCVSSSIDVQSPAAMTNWKGLLTETPVEASSAIPLQVSTVIGNRLTR
jgi:hypothetical protein